MCNSKKDPAKGAPTANQAKTYFLCDNELLVPGTYGGSGSHLYLVSDLKIEVAPNARPFNITTDGQPSAIDSSQQVYNIRGSYARYQCGTPDAGGGGSYPIGKNCTRSDVSKMTGMCYKDTFADWHCIYQNSDPMRDTLGQPAPVN